MPLSPEQKAAFDQRRSKAYELHLAGLTYAQIADRLDYNSISGAYGAVQAEIRRQTMIEDQPVFDQVPSELARLDAMLVGLWPKARRGDVHAIDRVLKIGERRAMILSMSGLDRKPPPEANTPEESGLDEFTRRLRDREADSSNAGQPGAS